MSAKLPVDILFDNVINKGLCTRCGTCAGVCPTDNIHIGDPVGSSLPVHDDNCSSCGLCLSSCPGERVKFKPLERSLFQDQISHPLLGVTKNIYLSHAVDPEIRRAGASGGLATALQLYLFRRKLIVGSVLYTRHRSEPWRGEGRVIEDEVGIKEASQSRYHLSPMNTILGDLKNREGKYAYVGLPCHVHGLRKLEKTGWKANAEINPVIGIYCGNNLYFEATRVILRKLGVKSLGDVASLSYREGSWPGCFSVTDRSGQTKEISKLDFNQTIPFYINHRCLTCIDLTNELSDISVGDGWAKEEAAKEGWSVVLTRSETGDRIVKDAAAAGIIHIEEISAGDAVAMHSHAFDLKKKGAFIRLKLWKKWGIAVPRYDRAFSSQKLSRKIVEVLVSLQFLLCSSRGGRAVFNILPLAAMGKIFRSLRKLWMKISK
ncbi:MAG: Coenzyme F420 hydrogenase/dehydrogenase, beta subunit C-terminal domain [Candidatus Krumholzibacteriota bacterium]|nr:Coenzyme F420 hydrogenase/dehydrogenase, beta subunit C-terminal domain [Candidatus Krumholzibacteriota bacterium]